MTFATITFAGVIAIVLFASRYRETRKIQNVAGMIFGAVLVAAAFTALVT